MGLYFFNIDKQLFCFFIIRSSGDEFRSIFGDILSYLSSNIGNEGKTFNSSVLAILIIVDVILKVMSVNDFAISYQEHGVIFSILFIPPMLFINYKLLLVVRKSRRNKTISPEMKKTFSFKTISSCLLAVACVAVFSIPLGIYIGLTIHSTETTYTLDNATLAARWTQTTALMNCTFNCLIFYWKNKVLRNEGLKVLKSMKIFKKQHIV